ncbi:MAG: ribosomal protein S18-alanine N-acetyltransferase [Gammaproteobacteria bacterium]|nr:ribosomal protein S18-alanine N-acetyltransferase [Gammaproteobacteria bacterium]
MNAAVAFDAVRFRVLLPADIDHLAAMERRAYAGKGWNRGIFTDCLRNGYICRGLVAGERISGYYIVSVGAGESHLLNLVVDPDCQRRGFGRSLLFHALAEACQAGAECIFLEVRPSNVAARRLYEQEGFSEFGRRRGYYPASERGGPEDALVLCLKLQRPS